MELPEHVFTRPGRKGQVYAYWQRYRNTESQWPVVRIPAPPHESLFWAYAEQCTRLRWTGGEWTFTSRFGAVEHVDPKADGFWDRLKFLDETDTTNQKTWARLCDLFDVHLDREVAAGRKSTKTAEGYRRTMRIVRASIPEEPVAETTPEDIATAMDAFEGHGAANEYRSGMSALFAHGVPRGFRTDNPVRDVPKREGGTPYEPWPEWAFELFFEHWRADMHMTVISALFTGQRLIDVVPMMRPRPNQAYIEIFQEKTGIYDPIPIHTAYRSIIEASVPIDSAILHINATTERQWTVEGFKTAWTREKKQRIFKPFRDHRVVFHGLRKNAVVNLLEVGCTEDQAGAVVGMSSQMVRHYGKRVSLRKLAQAALDKWERATNPDWKTSGEIWKTQEPIIDLATRKVLKK